MNTQVMNLQTDETVLKKLKDAASRKMTADEVQEQRVSFVLGTMKTDNALTREQIKRAIAAQESDG